MVERSLLRNLPVPADELESELQALEKQAATRLVTFGAAESGIMLQRFADLKYGMQAHVLEVPLEPELDEQAMGRIPSSFGEIYERIFGLGTAYREAGVQLTAVRVQAVAPVTNTGQKLRPPARSQTVTESSPDLDARGMLGCRARVRRDTGVSGARVDNGTANRRPCNPRTRCYDDTGSPGTIT